MNIKEIINEVLMNIFGFIQIKPEYTIEVSGENVYEVSIDGEDLSFLIGHRGQSLEALQTIVSLNLHNKTGEQHTVIVDINGYRKNRVERLGEFVKSYIDRVRFFNKEVKLPPMNPWERRQIHVIISEYSDVESESMGEGRDRQVVLKPKKKLS